MNRLVDAKKKKLNRHELPTITVITVVYNGVEFIERTLKSVTSQNYKNLEYIVVDGGSNDGTQDVIKKYQHKISRWSSEKDCGIYDAMNKGLNAATGRWVNFMNAGDEFISNSTIKEIFTKHDVDAGIVYGAVEIVYPEFSRLQQPGQPENLWQGMQFSHQSAFIDTQYHRERLYNTQNRIAADLEFFYCAHKEGARFKNCQETVSRVITGGVSEVNRINAIWASRNAICRGEFRPFLTLFYIFRIIDAQCRGVLKKILPKGVVQYFILKKR